MVIPSGLAATEAWTSDSRAVKHVSATPAVWAVVAVFGAISAPVLGSLVVGLRLTQPATDAAADAFATSATAVKAPPEVCAVQSAHSVPHTVSTAATTCSLAGAPSGA